MPAQQNWIFTITFKGNMTSRMKYRKIATLPECLSQFINFRVNKDPVILKYNIEYHKIKGGPFDGEDNTTAPHLHGILTLKKLSMGNSQLIYEYLSKTYGKTQFYLVENSHQLDNWREYIHKDVDRLNNKYNTFKHDNEVQLNELSNNIFKEDSDSDDF